MLERALEFIRTAIKSGSLNPEGISGVAYVSLLEMLCVSKRWRVKDPHMPLCRTKSRCLPIGLTLEPDMVRLVQAQHTDGGTLRFITSTAPIEVGNDDSDEACTGRISQAIQAAVSSKSFVGHGVVSCLPPAQIELVRLRLPDTRGKGMHQVVQSEVAEALCLPGDAFQTAYYEVGQVMRGRESYVEVIAVVAQIETLNAYCRLIGDAGLELAALDAGHAALARGLSAGLVGTTLAAAPMLVLHVQGPRISLIKIDNGEACYVRKIFPVQSRRPCTEGSTSLQMTALSKSMARSLIETGAFKRPAISAREMAHEIEHTVHYLQNFDSATPGAVHVSSDHSEQDLVDGLREVSGLSYCGLSEALREGPFSEFQLTEDSANLSPWLTGIGLSLYGREQAIGKGAA